MKLEDIDKYVEEKAALSQAASTEPKEVSNPTPSLEDIDKYVQEKKQLDPNHQAPGMLETLARGTEQTALMGFGDELNGGVEAVYDTLAGNNKDLSFADKYKLRRDESRARMKEAAEENPWSYRAGMPVGILAQAAVTGPLGGLASSAKSVGGAIADGIITGAGYGAATGLGESEGATTQDLVTDTTKGALLGGLTGGVAGTGAHYLGDRISQYGTLLNKKAGAAADTMSRLLKLDKLKFLTKMGIENETPVYGGTSTIHADKLYDTLKGLHGDLDNEWHAGATAQASLLDSSKTPYDLQNKFWKQIEPQLRDAWEKAPSWERKQYEAIEEELRTAVARLGPNPTPRQVEDQIIKPLRVMSGIQTENMSLTDILKKQLQGEELQAPVLDGNPLLFVKSILKREPNLSHNQVGLGFNAQSPAIVDDLNAHVPGLDGMRENLHNILTTKTQTAKLFSDIQKADRGTLEGSQSREMLKNLATNMPALYQKYADTLNKQVGLLGASQQVERMGYQHSILSDNYKGSTYAAANLTGHTIRNIAELTPTEITKAANFLITKGTPHATYVANALKAAAGRDNVGRNALIFTLQQNPNYRKLLEETFLPKQQP